MEWTLKGIIICQIAPGSYQIKLKNGNLTLRNIRDIKKVHTLVLQRPETMTAIVSKNKGTMITFMKTLTLTAQFHTGLSKGFRYWGGSMRKKSTYEIGTYLRFSCERL